MCFSGMLSMFVEQRCHFNQQHVLLLYHETLNDDKVVIDDLGEGSQAVCCTGCIAMGTKQ